MHGFALWFDVAFVGSGGGEAVVLSTSPDKPATHWKQTLFYLDAPVALQQDDRVTGSISFAKSTVNARCVVHTLTWSVNGGAQQHKVFEMK